MQQENIVLLKIENIVPNQNQPRKTFNENALNELASSIKEYGILNPILVRKKDNIYEIIAGERRYRAAKIAGLTEIPAIIKNITDEKLLEIALIENLQRENITPIEEATTYETILQNKKITEQQLSELIGKSQSFISNKLRLLKLPQEIQIAINNKKISEKHARSLLSINNQEIQMELLQKIINEKLSVKELDRIINEKKEEKESDNMNNGSFFPNYNNQDNNNVTLNQMNMQTMAGMNNGVQQTVAPLTEQIVSESTTIQPTMNQQPVIAQPSPLPQVEIQNMESPTPVEPIMPELNSTSSSPIPDFGMNAMPTTPIADTLQNSPSFENLQASTPTIQPEATSQPIDIPLFNGQLNQQPQQETQPIEVIQPMAPIENTVEQPTSTQPSQTVDEQPLFNHELTNNSQPNLNESFYEVPVNVSPVIETAENDKFKTVQQLLSSNNIEYKAYSNEKGHCIIIEL